MTRLRRTDRGIAIVVAWITFLALATAARAAVPDSTGANPDSSDSAQGVSADSTLAGDEAAVSCLLYTSPSPRDS